MAHKPGVGMRRTLAGLAIILIVPVSLSTGSRAQKEQQQQQQWCAYFTGGPTNCGFATFAQCLEAIRGKTGLCEQNAESPTARSTNGRRNRSDGH
jgi:hypothetical protein